MHTSILGQSIDRTSLLRALSSAQGLDKEGIARLLGKTPRTAQRIIRELRARNVPLTEDVVDPRTGRKIYRLPTDWPASPLDVDAVDLLALRVLLASNPARDDPFADAVERLAAKLGGVLRPEQARLADALAAQIGRAAPPRGRRRRAAGSVDELLTAARYRNPCEVRYAKPGHSPARYVIEPLGLFPRAGHYYCVARKQGPDTVQVFRLDRFRDVRRRRAEHFDPPTGFDLRTWMAAPLGVCHGPRREVRLRFDAALAAYAAEAEWHETQKLEPLPDGRVDVTFEAEGDEEILAWAARFTDRAELIEPAELRAELAARLARAAVRYGPAHSGQAWPRPTNAERCRGDEP